jgi:hypothetical protein
VAQYFRIEIAADLGTSVTGIVQTIYSKDRTQVSELKGFKA